MEVEQNSYISDTINNKKLNEGIEFIRKSILFNILYVKINRESESVEKRISIAEWNSINNRFENLIFIH